LGGDFPVAFAAFGPDEPEQLPMVNIFLEILGDVLLDLAQVPRVKKRKEMEGCFISEKKEAKREHKQKPKIISEALTVEMTLTDKNEKSRERRKKHSMKCRRVVGPRYFFKLPKKMVDHLPFSIRKKLSDFITHLLILDALLKELSAH
jgi:hypothetical protein